MHYTFSDRCVLCVFCFVKPVKSSYRTRLWRRDFHESNSLVDYNRIVSESNNRKRINIVSQLLFRRNCVAEKSHYERDPRGQPPKKHSAEKSRLLSRRFHRVSDDAKDRLTNVGKRRAGFVFQDPGMKWKKMEWIPACSFAAFSRTGITEILQEDDLK